VSTRRYLLKKILLVLITLLAVLAFNFFLFRGLGDPTQLLVRNHANMTAKALADEKAQLGLDLPLIVQFVHYIGQTLIGHLGYSTQDFQTVSSEIAGTLWPTVLLVGSSTVACTFVGLWIGIAQGWRWGTRFDQIWLGFTLILYAMPEFWFGLMVIMLLSVTIHLFPSGGITTPGSGYTGVRALLDLLWHLTLPFLVLVLSYLAEYSLIMRSSLTEVLGEDYILTARAKGVREKMVRRRHAVPNALLAPVTLSVLYLGYIFGGAILIETIFSWPGLGQLTYAAVQNRDFPLLEGLFLLFSAAVVFSNLAADLLLGYLDPRVREA
jgi:peptide/nickel transport system permease protein